MAALRDVVISKLAKKILIVPIAEVRSPRAQIFESLALPAKRVAPDRFLA